MGEPKVDFEPVIVAFCCHYCAYTAADQAGAQRLSYPANVKIVRVPCSGKVDALHLLKAFEKGADGAFVAGCLEGDCHFNNGNLRASRKVKQVQDLMAEIGLESERLEMVMISAGQGERFAEVATEMTDKIRELGPSPVRGVAPAKAKAQG